MYDTCIFSRYLRTRGTAMTDTCQEGNANEAAESAAGYSTSIDLPSAQVFRNLKNANRFAIDIGKRYMKTGK